MHIDAHHRKDDQCFCVLRSMHSLSFYYNIRLFLKTNCFCSIYRVNITRRFRSNSCCNSSANHGYDIVSILVSSPVTLVLKIKYEFHSITYLNNTSHTCTRARTNASLPANQYGHFHCFGASSSICRLFLFQLKNFGFKGFF